MIHRGYRNRFALPAGVMHPDPCWTALAFSTSPANIESGRQAAKDIVDDAIDTYEDHDSAAILAEGLRNHIQTRLNVVGELREEWWGPRSDDPLRQVSLASWIHSIACYAQIVDLLSQGIPQLLAAYEDEALIFQGRRYVPPFTLTFLPHIDSSKKRQHECVPESVRV